MLSNAYLLAKFRADTAENERNFAEILPKNLRELGARLQQRLGFLLRPCLRAGGVEAANEGMN